MKFIPVLSDVPAFYKIDFYEDSIVEFDSSWGSVAEIDGKCKCKCKTVEDYYDLTMPNLGWGEFSTDAEEKLYIRDGINLIMTTEDSKSGCNINFSQTN